MNTVRNSFFDGIWLVAVGAVASAAIVAGAGRLSATFDEPTYLAKGLECWRTGSYKSLMRLGTMPLAIDAQTLPLYLREQWRGTPFDVGAEFDKILPVARAVTLGFYWLLLVYGMLIARQLAGPWAGRLAVVLLAVEPTIFAHAGLATTDTAVAAMLLAFAYHFANGRSSRWPLRIALPAILYAAAILAKASGLVFGPILMFVIEAHRLASLPMPAETSSATRFSVGDLWRRFRPLRIDATWIMTIGLVLTFLYVGSDWKAETTFVQWSNGLSDGRVKDWMVWLSTNTRVFTNAGEGIVQQIKHNLRGHGAFLLDHTWRRSVWYYFPVALSMKLSIPLLAGVLIALVGRSRALWQWPALAALALLTFSLNTKVQIGVRMLMPLIALAIVAVAVAFARWTGGLERRWQRVLLLGVVLSGVGWNIIECAAVWPNGLSYVNRAWGGMEHGYHLVSDSNYDWGQGLKELEDWAARNHRPSVSVWYFGADPAVRRAPLQLLAAHHTPDASVEEIAKRTDDGWIAVGTTIMYGAYVKNVRLLDYLRTQTPVDRTTTFLIYRLPTTNHSNLVRQEQTSGQMTR